MDKPDILDALAPASPPHRATITLAGQVHSLPPLTLGRLAGARKFSRAFAQMLQQDDVFVALSETQGELIDLFTAVTGIPGQALAEVSADEALEAFFVLLREVRDFSGGSLTAALNRGAAMLAPAAAAAPDGVPSSPGSSDAGTASTS